MVDMHLICSPYEASPLTTDGFVLQEMMGSVTEWFFLISILVLLVHGVWWSTSPFLGRPSMMQNTMSLSFLLLGLCLWLVMARFQSFPAFTLFKSNLVFDDFSMKVSILLVGATIVCLLLSRDYVAEEKVNFFEFSILVLLSCLGGCWLVASYDFFTMYMTIELLSLPLYALASIKTRSLLSTEAGLKYFILGAFSSGMFLFGVSLLYFATGSLSFSEIGQLGMTSDTLTTETCAYLMGLFFVLVGLLFKLTAVPFHMWAPDVYEGAPTPVTAYFSIVPKLAVFAITIRVVYVSFFDVSLEWQKAMVLSAIGSMVLGTLGAMSQKLDLKRLLAYSAIGNAGYMLLGIASGNLEGLQGILLFAVIYMVMTMNAFATLLALKKRESANPMSMAGASMAHQSIAGGSASSTFLWERETANVQVSYFQGSEEASASATTSTEWLQTSYNPRHFTLLSQNSLGSLKGIGQFRTISKTNPLLAITIAFAFLSMAGVPPLAGFIGKMYLFFAAVNGGLYVAVFVGILANVVASFYYIRCIKLAYFDGTKEWISLGECGKEVSLILGITSFFLSFFFLFPTTTVLWVSNAVAVL